VKESPRPAIARLLPDGSLDTSFKPDIVFAPDPTQEEGGPPPMPPVHFAFKLCLQSDGKIFLFTYGLMTESGQPLPKLIRLNTDGSRDVSFVLGLFRKFPVIFHWTG
jgi:hypothetical protein